MARRILPHITGDILGAALLAPGEVVVNDTTLDLHIGDGATPGGIALGALGTAAVGTFKAQLLSSAGGTLVRSQLASALPVRPVADKLYERISVQDFGAVGDDVTDDTAAIQAAVNHMKGRLGGTIFFPRGDYKITAPIDCGDTSTGLTRVLLLGEQGVGFGGAFLKCGSRVVGTHAGNLFQWANADMITFDGLTFDGFGCTAVRQTGVPTVNYLSNIIVRNCHFFTHLKECLYGNFIYLKVFDSTFGFYGTPSKDRAGTPPHRHIYSLGTSTNTSNLISLRRNRFYYAYGSESVRIENGAQISICENNLEQNDATPIRLYGIVNARVHHNWFEMNRITQYEIEAAPTATVIDGSGLVITSNLFVHAPQIQRVVNMLTPNTNFSEDGWIYEGNTPTAVPITNNYARLRDQVGTFQISDGSGANLGVLAAGKFKRVNNVVHLKVDFGFPTNANANNNKLTGLPFISDGVATAAVLSNIAPAAPAAITIADPPTKANVEAVMAMAIAAFNAVKGIQIATDAGQSTATLFAQGTLTPLSNAQLSGKAMYITLSYFV